MPLRSVSRFQSMVAPAALLVSLLLLSPFAVLPVASDDQAAEEVSSGWGGCVNPETGYEPVTIGKPTTVCLVVSNNGDWTDDVTYMRLNFAPIADQYSRFHVPESFSQLVGDPQLGEIFTGNITVHAEAQTALSFQKLYYNSERQVFPFLTAIISVDEGSVTGITWDNACVFCGSKQCVDNTYGYDGEIQTEEGAKQPVGACFNTVEACKESTTAECDLMLYVVWTGTDANGRDFRSSANRFSAFPAQSWADRINLSLPDVGGWFDNINPFNKGDGEETESN